MSWWDALPQALRAGGPAEWFVAAGVGVALLWNGGLWGLRARGRVPPMVLWLVWPSVQIALGAWAAAFRLGQVPDAALRAPARALAGLTASHEAAAGRGLAWALGLAALELGVAAVALSGSGRADLVRALAPAAAALGAIAVAARVGGDPAPALALLLVAWAWARQVDDRFHRDAVGGLAALCAAGALGVATWTARADVLVLAEPTVDLPRLVALPWLVGLGIGGTCLTAVVALAELPGLPRWSAGVRGAVGAWVALGVLGAVVLGTALQRAEVWAPPRALLALDDHPGPQAPLHPDPSVYGNHRVVGGCLVRPGPGEEGWSAVPLPMTSESHHLPPCPARLRDGHDPDAMVLVATTADAPSTDLDGWFEGDLGLVGVLWRLVEQPPRGAARWAWGWMPVESTPAPRRSGSRYEWAESRAKPVPGSVLVDLERSVLYAQGEHRLQADLAAQVQRSVGGRRRLDVLLIPHASWTVQDVLDACVHVARLPGSVRCRLAAGDADAWREWASAQ